MKLIGQLQYFRSNVDGKLHPCAVCWGSLLDMHLLPDYLVYAGSELLDWGFWENDWKPQKLTPF